MRNDHRLQAAILQAVEVALGDDAPGVGVAVADGCVLLTGLVPNAAARASAVHAAFGVPGVTTVHDAITVHPPSLAHDHDEIELTRSVAAAIAWAAESPGSVRAEVYDGTVVLSGRVGEGAERRAVRRAVELVHGVERVDDRIRVDRAESLTP